MPELPLRRKILFSFIPLFAVTVAGLAGVEAYIRLTSPYGYVTPETLRAQTPDYQPAVLARHVIRQEAKTVIVNGREQFRINLHGYRGRDFSATRPAGTTRIMFYGGSSVFDADSPQDDDWPHRVERNLRAKGFANLEVINAGIPGYSSAEAVTTLFSEGHNFQPNYVVLYAQWNDIKLLTSDRSLLRQFTRDDAPEDPRVSYQNWADMLLSRTSQLYVRLRARYYTWKLDVGAEGAKPAGDYSSTVNPQGLRQYKLNLETFVDIARSIGAVPILMIEARLVARSNTDKARSRISYDYVLLTHEALCRAFEQQDEIILEIGRRKGVRVIDVARQLTGRDELFENHIHLNPQGSNRLAELVANELAVELGDRRAEAPHLEAQ